MATREELLRELDIATRAGDVELAQIIDKEIDALPTDAQARANAMPWQVRGLTGLGEAGLQAITGLGATVAGGLAGLADLGLSSIGKGSGSPGDTVRKVQEFGTYQPRTAQGQRASDLLGAPMAAYAKAVRAGGDAIRGDSAGGVRDFLGTTFDVAGESAPVALGGMAALRSAAKAPKPPLTRAQETLAAAQKEGYTVPPSMMGQKSWLEGAGGKIRTSQLHSAKNAEVTSKIAVRELGMPEGTTLTPEILSRYRKDAYDVGYVPLKQKQTPLVADQTYYGEVVVPVAEVNKIKASFPEAKVAGAEEVTALADGLANVRSITYEAAVERIRQLRFDAKKNMKAFDDPAKSRLGHAQDAAAKSLENLIERNLAQSGDEALLANFRYARQQIAKSHTVEDALNPATGVVSARDIAKSKSPKTGGLKTASDFATAFPKAVQKQDVFGGTPPISPLDMSMGTIAALGGTAATGSPAGLLAAGVPLLRPLAAPVTRAPFVQNGLVRNPSPMPPEMALLPFLDPASDRRIRR